MEIFSPYLGSLLLGLAVLLAVFFNFNALYRFVADYRKNYIQGYKRLFDEMFMPVNIPRFLLLHAAALVATAVLSYYLLGGLLFPVLLTVFCYFAPKLHLNRKRKQRLAHLNDQVMDALGLISNSLKAGLTLAQAFESAVHQMEPPISEELTLMMREYEMGVPIDRAMLNMTERVPSPNLDIFISSILISRRTGGNIAEVLEKMADSMKEVHRLEGKIDALTSQGKAQGWVLSLLPLFLALILYKLDKTMLIPLVTTPQGYALCLIIILLWAIGVFFVWKIVSVEV